MTDEMSNKQFCRVRSNAQAEAGLEHRKLREEIERLRALVEQAYREGHIDNWQGGFCTDIDEDWCDSDAKRALTGSPERQKKP